MADSILMICPKCGKAIAEVKNDNKVHKIACQKCSKWIFFIPEAMHYEIHNIPDRSLSSGKRFY